MYLSYQQARSLVKATKKFCGREGGIDREDAEDSFDDHATNSSYIIDLEAAKCNAQEHASRVSEPETDISVAIAFDILVKKGIKKTAEYLTACNILFPSARDIASFLRLHQKRFDASALGDYLGEENLCGGNQWNLILYHYVRVISFVGMKVDEA
jgi:Sec7-like guanine-nucleotide exchange factor